METEQSSGWSCVLCTFENEACTDRCAICLNVRKRTSDSSATSLTTSVESMLSTPKKAKFATGKKNGKQQSTIQSLVVAVGSSAEREAARLKKKLDQMRELGIDLPSNELIPLLARHCYSVQVAASAYFEQLTLSSSSAAEQNHTDAATQQRLARVIDELESSFACEPFRLVGSTIMSAIVSRSGVNVSSGDQLRLQAEDAGKKRLRPGTMASSVSGIVRIATMQHVQIGRLERELEMLLHPLMKEGLVQLAAVCERTPLSLQMFASFDIRVFLYVNVNAFGIFNESHPKFHLADAFYTALQLINPSGVANGSSGSLSSAASSSSEVNVADLETLFSEFVDASDLREKHDDNTVDPADQLEPFLNAIELREHQKQALMWMLWRENQQLNGSASDEVATNPMWETRTFHSDGTYFVNPFEKIVSLEPPDPPVPCLGGILADDMGMGKTMMMLALIAHQKYFGGTNEESKGLKKTKKQKTLIVCPLSLLHQWKNEIEQRFLPNTLTVHAYYGEDRDRSVITRSDIVLTTYGVLSKEYEKADSTAFLINTEWHRVILDEAHSIKNRMTTYFRACAALRATHRWCLTGTPIQNSLEDMFSLLSFLQYIPWSRIAWWKRVIMTPYEEGDDVNALGRLKVILRPILLRRTKHSRDYKGVNIVQLPPKHVELVKLEFSAEERAFYQTVYDKSRAEFNGYVASGAAMSSYVAILALLLRLRQACNHPLLALGRDFEQVSMNDTTDGTKGDSLVNSLFQPQRGESMEAYYRRISAQLQQEMQACSQTTISNGEDIQHKSGGLTQSYINSVIAQMESGIESQECPICLDPPVNGVLTPCAHMLCEQCLLDTLANDPESGCPVCRAVVDITKVFALPTSADVAQQEHEDKNVSEDTAEEMQTSETGDNVIGFQSAKLKQLLHDLKLIRQENEHLDGSQPKRKVVVFSQWTYMLEMVAKLLKRHGFKHCMFTGAMNQESRERVLTQFAKDPAMDVLVISLKAGGVGLNLTCASVVILLDPWWNPGVEDQAIDRVHRLGQTQEVLVKRYIVMDTVEDMILQLQQRKEKLAKHVLIVAKAGEDKRNDRLNLDDLKSFFR